MTGLGCVSVGGCKAPLDLLERLAFSGAELAERIPRLRAAAGASALAVLSTCQRVELYASWPGEPDLPALTAALAADRGVPGPAVSAAATAYAGDAAARHLLRVATGLESFVLGETEVAGQVRAAAEASRLAGGDVALDRLLDTAVSAARRVHRCTGVAATSRSVAAAAVDAVAGDLPGRRLLLVGAGQVAATVVDPRRRPRGARDRLQPHPPARRPVRRRGRHGGGPGRAAGRAGHRGPGVPGHRGAAPAGRRRAAAGLPAGRRSRR